MTSTLPSEGLHEQLERWVSQGLIDAGQAALIEAAEATHAPGTPAAVAPPTVTAPAAPVMVPAAAPPVTAPAPAAGPAERPERRALAIEALGYLGGILAIIAGFVAVQELWPDIPTAAQLAFAGTGAVLLAIAGALIPFDGEAALARLRSVLWLMSTASLASFVGVLAHQVWHADMTDSVLFAAAAATAYAIVLWLRAPSPLQHVGMFAAATTTAGLTVASVGPSLNAWGPGLAIWGLSALWAVAVHLGYLGSRNVGYPVAAVGLLVGGMMTRELATGQVLSLATVAGLLAAGVVLRRVSLMGIGALGVLFTVPETAGRYLPESVGAPLSLFVVGLVLLGIALWLARWRKPKHR